ncbi:MAG: thiamine diphosphokinase [Mucinivorans sp.]
MTQKNSVVILADGSFPTGSQAMTILKSGLPIVCCDGAVDALVSHGQEPWAVVGDCDSISPESAARFAAILHRDPDQQTNDLTKAVEYCIAHHLTDITILGATGRREDHTLGNISLLADYSLRANVRMVSDYGEFRAISSPTTFRGKPGDQVSIFVLDPTATVHYQGLLYTLPESRARSWWSGTLNEVTGDSFTIDTHVATIVFRVF